MATIAFNTDIAPLRSQFFPVGGMRQSEFRQLMGNYTQSILPMQEQALKRANSLLNMQAQDLAYQRSQEALAATRRKAKGEIEAMEQMPTLMQSLDNILNDESKDAFEQTSDITRLQMSMAGALPYSPAMQNLFTSAAQTAQANAAKARKEEEDLRRKEQREAGILHTLGQVGAQDAIRKRITDPSSAGGAEITSQEQAYDDLASVYKGRAETATKQKQQEFERAEFKSYIDNQRKGLLRHESTLMKMGAVDEDFIAQSLRTGVVPENPPVSNKTQFSADDRRKLEEIMLDLNPNLDPDFIKQSSTEDLHRAAIRTSFQSLRRLNETTSATTGTTPTGASTIASNFD
jgi:hypothetical protein